MVIAAVGSTGYKILFLLHILSVIVGFGGVMLNALYARRAGRVGGREGAAVSLTNVQIGRVSEVAIYTVPVWGILLIIASGKVAGGKFLYDFSEPWVGAGFALYVVIVGLYHGLLRPAQRRLADGLQSGGKTDPLLTRVNAAGAAIDVLIVVVLVLMIWKPGQ
jgi:hypothetical protein